MMPGRTLHRLAARLCSRKTLERIIEPTIADLQKEYTAGAVSHARRVWLLARGYAAILIVLAICALSLSITTEEERNVLIRTLAWSAVLIIVSTAVLILPPLYSFGDAIRGWYAALLLLPQAVPLAIPIGVVFGIAFGLRARPAMSIVKMTLLCALAASVVSLSILAWAMPAGNQAFREMTFQALKARGDEGPSRGPQKAYNEMTFTELRREIAGFAAAGETGLARQYHHRLHLRVSLAAATLVLAGFLLAAPLNHRVLRGLLALAACFVYWVLIFVGEGLAVSSPVAPAFVGTLPVFAGAWLPNIVFAALTLLVQPKKRRPV